MKMPISNALICVLIMTLVTYIPRVLPVTIFRKQIKSKFLCSFLAYTPYAVLGALTFPEIFYSTGNCITAIGGAAVALILGYFNKSLCVVALSSVATVYILELVIQIL